jgi:hypothetical protein
VTRPPRTIGDYEAIEAERLLRDHGHRLALHHAREKAELAAVWDERPAVVGAARHQAEVEKRARLRREVAELLATPLHRDVLTTDERFEIRRAESLRRRPVGKP